MSATNKQIDTLPIGTRVRVKKNQNRIGGDIYPGRFGVINRLHPITVPEPLYYIDLEPIARAKARTVCLRHSYLIDLREDLDAPEKITNKLKIRSLSEYATTQLRYMAQGPVARQSINPGAVWRLVEDGLAESVMLPSPYPTHKGQDIEHLSITDAGREIVMMQPRRSG
ncbi:MULTISPECIES: hypothetical protein [Methylobacter]